MKPDAGKPSWVRVLRAFGYAGQGVRLAARDRMLRVQIVIAAVVIATGVWLRVSRTDWAILTLTMAGVMAMEVMNTAIEAVVDLVTPDAHPLAGRAKDLAAGAVLVASLGSIVVGLLIFGPLLWSLIAR